MDSPWKLLDRETVLSTPIFEVRRDRKTRPTTPNRARDFYVLDTCDWVNVIPLTSQNEVVFIEVYRQAVESWSLEVPGGMIDPDDDSPAAAGARELKEETGYTSDPLVELGAVQPNPAIQQNQCFSFLAPNAIADGPQDLDPGEDIRVVLHPLDSLPDLMSQGRIRHALVVAAFYWFDRFR